jgi:hypothetical protein
MSKQTESNGPARQEKAIQEVRSNPEKYFHSARREGGSMTGSASPRPQKPRRGN